MRSKFQAWYSMSEEEYAALWEECVFVFDSNVLLDIYKYSVESRGEIIGLLVRLKERSWIPHQVGLEYQRQRITVILKQIENINGLIRQFKSMPKDISDEIVGAFKRQPVLGTERYIAMVEEVLKGAISEYEERLKSYTNLLEKDVVRDKLDEVFNGRVGDPNDDKEYIKLYAKAKKRYAEKTPPGYLDDEKQEPQKYADYILWEQILEYAKDQKKDVILVNDDMKEDWYLSIKERKIGPRPELISEFAERTKKRFYMYPTGRFLKFANEHLETTDYKKVYEETKELQEARKVQASIYKALLEGHRATMDNMKGIYYIPHEELLIPEMYRTKEWSEMMSRFWASPKKPISIFPRLDNIKPIDLEKFRALFDPSLDISHSDESEGGETNDEDNPEESENS